MPYYVGMSVLAGGFVISSRCLELYASKPRELVVCTDDETKVLTRVENSGLRSDLVGAAEGRRFVTTDIPGSPERLRRNFDAARTSIKQLFFFFYYIYVS